MTSTSLNSYWTLTQNKLFERALALHEKDTPAACWQNVPRDVGGGKSAEEVRRHYEVLVRDLMYIESIQGRRHVEQWEQSSRGRRSEAVEEPKALERD